MSKLNLVVLLVLIILVAGTAVLTNTYETKLVGQKRDFEGKVAGLESQLSELQDQFTTLSSQQEKTSLSIKELQNREVVKQKSQDELLTAAVARVAPVVVSIVVSKDVPQLEVVYVNPFGDDPFFKNFDIRIPVYQQKGSQRQKVGAATGFLVTSDGYILTNKHVVADESANYTVLLANGQQKEAKVVYKDLTQDIAIIKIEGGGYGTASLGNSDSLQLGQTVAAIGNALGEYNNSVSVGIISGIDRTIEASGVRLEHVIQTDAAINPGNSGGPLLDLNGRVVGINVATVIGANSVGFSLPVNMVKGIVKTAIGR